MPTGNHVVINLFQIIIVAHSACKGIYAMRALRIRKLACVSLTNEIGARFLSAQIRRKDVSQGYAFVFEVNKTPFSIIVISLVLFKDTHYFLLTCGGMVIAVAFLSMPIILAVMVAAHSVCQCRNFGVIGVTLFDPRLTHSGVSWL